MDDGVTKLPRTLRVDHSGEQHGTYTVLRPAERMTGRTRVWVIRCGCGREREAGYHSIRCDLKCECSLEPHGNTTHGLLKTHRAEHGSWGAMRARCSNPRHRDYPDYGGRGIIVCERWNDFAAFVADMGRRPRGKTIERLDTNGDYEPGNCVWADAVAQANNKRNNIVLEWAGRRQTLAQWARERGIRRMRLYDRIVKLGWSPERALANV